MAAIPFAVPENVPGLSELYAEIALRKGNNPNRPNRGVSNMGKVLGHSPKALCAHQNLTTFVLDKSIVALPLRVLATLQVAAVLKCSYIIHNNLPRALRAGIDQKKITAVTQGGEAEFDAKERAVLNYARQVAQGRALESGTMSELRRLFSLQEISELVLIVATYHMIAAIVNPLEVEPDVHA